MEEGGTQRGGTQNLVKMWSAKVRRMVQTKIYPSNAAELSVRLAHNNLQSFSLGASPSFLSRARPLLSTPRASRTNYPALGPSPQRRGGGLNQRYPLPMPQNPPPPISKCQVSTQHPTFILLERMPAVFTPACVPD